MRFSVFSCALAAASTIVAQGDVVALLQSQPDLSTLLELVSLVPGLADTLASSSNITILAPTNAAWDELTSTLVEEEPGFPEGQAVRDGDVPAISALLANHVIQGQYPAASIGLVPTFVQTTLNQSFKNFQQPFSNATGGNYIGAVVNGQTVSFLSGENTVSNVVQADVPLGSGITIHVVDEVLKFGAPFQSFTGRANLISYNNAIQLAGLNDALGIEDTEETIFNDADLTVFVPNDEAFESIGSALGTLDVAALTDVLTYHVVRGSVLFSPDFANTTVQTIQGATLTLTVGDDGFLYVDGARVLFPNTLLYNGAAHIIDNVLNPSPASPFDRASIPPNAPPTSRIAFPGATSVADLPFTTFSAQTEVTYTTTPELLRTLLPYQAPESPTPIASQTPSVTASPSQVTNTPPAQYTGAANTVQGVGGVVGAVLMGAVAVGGLL